MIGKAMIKLNNYADENIMPLTIVHLISWFVALALLEKKLSKIKS